MQKIQYFYSNIFFSYMQKEFYFFFYDLTKVNKDKQNEVMYFALFFFYKNKNFKGAYYV